MDCNPTKVKGGVTKRFRVTIKKAVTLHYTSSMEVDVPARKGSHQTVIASAVEKQMARERKENAEREWSTKKVDENSYFYIDWGSIEEIEPHIEITADIETSR